MISIEVDSKPDKDWNKRLLQSSLGTIHHTYEFAEAKKYRGFDSHFLKFLNNNGKIIGQILLLSKLRFKNKKYVGDILKKLPGTKKSFFEWTYGPIIFENDSYLEISKTLGKFLISKKILARGTEHPLAERSFNSLGKPFKINEWCTFLVDLKQDPEKLWKKMEKHSVQKNIERSKKKGIYVKEMSKTDYLKYRTLSIETGKDSPLTKKEIEKQWDLFSHAGFGGFFAFENEIPVGAISFSFFNGYVNEFNIFRTQRDISNKLYAQDLLKWKIIEWANKKGFSYFDLSGVNPKPTNQKEIGILRYKKKWGGEPKFYYQIYL